MLQFLPYAMAAYGGYRGYKDSKDQGISGINRLLNTATGATLGYMGGSTIVGSPTVQSMFPSAAKFGGTGVGAVPTFTQLPGIRSLPVIGQGAPQTQLQKNAMFPGEDALAKDSIKKLVEEDKKRTISDMLLRNKKGEYDPLKISALAAGVPLAMGAFDQGPTDIYQPTYNVGYADFAEQRPGYTYIDPQTGQEKKYEKVYIPEADPKNQGDFRMGPYAMEKTRLRTGGLAEIRKFNEGGINYLPSKLEHDEDDANNYVRAQGYVEDGSGAGDKDEDTMLAQLADGEFVTRADGVLGAGIIAGANPNSMKDMREKGAQYFYEQQKRYKRVFDLLKDKYGDSTKTN